MPGLLNFYIIWKENETTRGGQNEQFVLLNEARKAHLYPAEFLKMLPPMQMVDLCVQTLKKAKSKN